MTHPPRRTLARNDGNNTMKFDDVELAFYYVSSNQPFINNAYISRTTGEVYYISEMGDSDTLPDDIDDEDKYISIPHKNELGLGRELVFEFVSNFLPNDIDQVRNIFTKKGAYSKFKQLLDRQRKLEMWHQFNEARQKAVLIDWCEENDIPID